MPPIVSCNFTSTSCTPVTQKFSFELVIIGSTFGEGKAIVGKKKAVVQKRRPWCEEENSKLPDTQLRREKDGVHRADFQPSRLGVKG